MDNVTSEAEVMADAPVNQEQPLLTSEDVDKLVQERVAEALKQAQDTKQSLEDVAAPNLIDAQHQKAKVYDEYMAEEMVEMYVSPTYRRWFGNVMPVTINGITIMFPIDGSTHSIPKTFADEITNRRVLIDKINFATDSMSDVRNNAEQAPGELELI